MSKKNKSKFKVGDIVRLKLGYGPDMIIWDIDKLDDSKEIANADISTTWFSQDDVQQFGAFPAMLLEHAN